MSALATVRRVAALAQWRVREALCGCEPWVHVVTVKVGKGERARAPAQLDLGRGLRVPARAHTCMREIMSET